MNSTVSKSQPSITTRLAEIDMSQHDRIRAAAQMERAEAMADALVWLCEGVNRLAKSVFSRPSRTASNAG